ncbi:MAG: cell division protein FtsX [Thermodesulfobacteriota bacterium]
MSAGAKSLRFFVSDAIAAIRGNLATSILTSLTLAFSLAICCFFLIVFLNLGSFFGSWGDNANAVAYIKDSVPAGNVKGMQKQLLRIKGVKGVSYVSKAEAMAELKKGLKGHSGILEGMDKGILPASFEIRLRAQTMDPEQILLVVKRIKSLPWVDELQYSQEWARKFYGIFKFFELTAVIIGAVLGAAAVFVITNTIRLTVYARREEIEVLRLVGASDTFISLPFLIEGLIEGFVGGVLASLLVFAVLLLLRYNVPDYLAFVLDTPLSVPVIFALNTLIGTLTGAIGSIISTGRFLKA